MRHICCRSKWIVANLGRARVQPVSSQAEEGSGCPGDDSRERVVKFFGLGVVH